MSVADRLVYTRSPLPNEQGNSATPVHRLPAELLYYIFDCLSVSAVFDSHVSFALWRPVLHVCQRWRRIASQAAILWRVIPLHSAEWAATALSRSEPRTIRLLYDAEAEKTPRQRESALRLATWLAMRDGRRVCEIRLNNADLHGEGRHTLAMIRGMRTDELVAFELGSPVGIAIEIREPVFRTDPAKLRRLSLTRCKFLHRPLVIANELTSLRLYRWQNTAAYSLGMTIQDIQSLELLETLSLSVELSKADNIASYILTDTTRVLLRRLRFYKVEGEYVVLLAILARIDAPPTCRLDLRACGLIEGFMPGPIEATMDGLARIFSPRISSAVVDAGMSTRVSIRSSPFRDGAIAFDVRKYAGLEAVRCEFCWGSISHPFRDGARFAPPSLSHLVSVFRCNISTLNIRTILDADAWAALRPLLSRTARVSFDSPSNTAHFPLDILRPLPGREFSRLASVRIDYPAEDNRAKPEDKYAFPLVLDIIRTSLPRISVDLWIGESLPTMDDVESLQSLFQSYPTQLRIFSWAELFAES